MMLRTDVAVVGAGPAGLSAALHASLAGAKVALVDEYPRLGGQYYKQQPAAFKVLDRASLGNEQRAGQQLLARIEEGKIAAVTSALVWGAYDPGVLEIYRDGECSQVSADRVVVATGAYDRPVPFPGWTLPGVITAGAAQTLAKTQWVLPGTRVLMAGTGPFQLPVATQLTKAGARVVGLLDANGRGRWIGQAQAALRFPDRMAEARQYLWTLLSARVPMMYGWTILEARGKDRVEQAVITRVDEQWKPVSGTERVLAVDTICIGFGFMPSLQLPRLLGCESRWEPDLSAWVTQCDADGRSSIPTVFVAGETTGIGGHDIALLEGAVAGMKAAADLGKISCDEAETRLRKVRADLERRRRFARLLNRTFAIGPGIDSLVRDDTVICRCEEATAGEIATAARRFGGSLRAIKQMTRAGCGPCQGRICGPTIARIASRESGKTLEEIGVDTPRPPIKPIPLQAFATMPA